MEDSFRFVREKEFRTTNRKELYFNMLPEWTCRKFISLWLARTRAASQRQLKYWTIILLRKRTFLFKDIAQESGVTVSYQFVCISLCVGFVNGRLVVSLALARMITSVIKLLTSFIRATCVERSWKRREH